MTLSPDVREWLKELRIQNPDFAAHIDLASPTTDDEVIALAQTYLGEVTDEVAQLLRATLDSGRPQPDVRGDTPRDA